MTEFDIVYRNIAGNPVPVIIEKRKKASVVKEEKKTSRTRKKETKNV